mmetsp:Transcript_27015/g.81948  ORF Transcript_27015/g.81948 Transcript_27015/m.81948 type:complete len:85 (-) Transcript_27015:114-368(-)
MRPSPSQRAQVTVRRMGSDPLPESVTWRVPSPEQSMHIFRWSRRDDGVVVAMEHGETGGSPGRRGASRLLGRAPFPFRGRAAGV